MRTQKPSEQEISEFNKFLWLHALYLNASNGAVSTGIIGGAVGFSLGFLANLFTGAYVWSNQPPEGTGGRLLRVGFLLTAGPGFLVGAATSPLRRIVFAGRTLEHRNERVLLFCEGLTNALGSSFLTSQNTATLGGLIGKIIEGVKLFSLSSDSSRELLYHLNGVTRMVNMNHYDDPMYHPDEPCRYGRAAHDTPTRIKCITEYLSATETPIPCSISTKYLKNQGKRLFNMIMDILEQDYQHLIPVEASFTSTMRH